MKNNRTYKKGLLLVLALVAMVSCSEDFLDVPNPSGVKSDEFVTGAGDLTSLLNATYSSFSKNEAIATIMENERTDLIYPGGFQRPFVAGSKIFYEQNFDNSARDISNKWSALYEGVHRANQVIVGYEKIAESIIPADSIGARWTYAQARALRGYFYFQLANSFNGGSVPLFKFPAESPEETRQDNATPAEVIEFYRKDLEFGMDNLPTDWSSSNYGRISAGACEALLGKSYLYQYTFADDVTREFVSTEDVPDRGEALRLAKVHLGNLLPEISSRYSYQLANNIGDNFTSLNEFNSESILEVNYSSALSLTLSGEQALFNTISDNIGLGQFRPSILPSSWLVVQYQRDSIDPTNPRNTINNLLYDSNFDGEPENEPTKLRRYSERMSHSIAYVDDQDVKFYSGEITERVNQTAFRNQITPYMFKKLTNWDISSSDEFFKTPDGRSGVNLRLIRLADIYLMYAECLIEDGDFAQARDMINKVRDRSGVVLLGPATGTSFNGSTYTTTAVSYIDGVTASKAAGYIDINGNGNNDVFERWSYDDYETLRYHLRHVERPLELALEGNAIRAIDLRRWGKTAERFNEVAQNQYALTTYRFYRDNYVTNADYNTPATFSSRWGVQLFPYYEATNVSSEAGEALDQNDNVIYHVFDEKFESRRLATPGDTDDNILELNQYTVKADQASERMFSPQSSRASRKALAEAFRDCIAASRNFSIDKAYLPIPLTEVNAKTKNN